MTIRLYMAPLRGFTDSIYRNTFNIFFGGFDVAVAPFISTTSTKKIKRSRLKDVLPKNNSSIKVIPQLLSKSADDFIVFADRLFDLGYEEVNWNLGCPFPMVAKKKRGSGLLPHPDMIDSFLEKTIPSIPNKLSVKTRLGRESADEIVKLMPIFNQYPLKEIIIHPRTGIQMYMGEPDLEMFEKCLPLADHPLVYNGDITDLDTFIALSGRFKTIDSWMIGRGALANPFLPSIIRNGVDIYPNKVDKIKEFHDMLFEQYDQVLSGPSHIVDRMKGFWGYFSRSFENGRVVLKKIHKTRKKGHYLDTVARFFDTDAVWIA